MNFDFQKKYECPQCPVHQRKEAYYFFPDEKEEIKTFEDDPTRVQRFIFWKNSLSDYTKFEQDKLKEFIQYFLDNNKAPAAIKEAPTKEDPPKEEPKQEAPQLKKAEDDAIVIPKDLLLEELIRVIQCGAFDNPKIMKSLRSYLTYRVPIAENDKYMEIVKTGLIYQNGITANFSPILIFKIFLLKELQEKYNLPDVLAFIDRFMFYLIEHFFIPGQVERWHMIVDLKNFAMPKINLLKEAVGVLQGKYICRLAKMYFINANVAMKYMFNLVKNFIDADTQKKFIFLDKENADELFRDINKSQIEEKYGGNAKDIEDYSCPFNMPEGNNLVDESKGKIITEEEYVKLCGKKRVSKISPYICEKYPSYKEIGEKLVYCSDLFIKDETNEGKEIFEGQESLANRCQCSCSIF